MQDSAGLAEEAELPQQLGWALLLVEGSHFLILGLRHCSSFIAPTTAYRSVNSDVGCSLSQEPVLANDHWLSFWPRTGLLYVKIDVRRGCVACQNKKLVGKRRVGILSQHVLDFSWGPQTLKWAQGAWGRGCWSPPGELLLSSPQHWLLCSWGALEMPVTVDHRCRRVIYSALI